MFPVDDGYKETVLGSMPLDWNIEELGNHYDIQQGKAMSKKHREGKSPSHFLRTANVLWGKLDLGVLDQMDFTDNERDKLRLKKGDLLICEGGDIGRTAIWNEEVSDCYYQNHVFRVRSNSEEAYSPFHMYWMDAGNRLLGHYRGYGNITTIPNLSKRRLSSFPIPLPPLPEQSAIAHVLNTVRLSIGATEWVIAAARELKRSMMKHLFTYGPVRIDQADQVPLMEAELGSMPLDWNVEGLGNHYDIQQGKAMSKKHREGKSPSHFLRTANVLWGKLDLGVLDQMDFTDNERDKLRLKKGDLLICEGGDIGRTAIWNEEVSDCYYQNHVFRVRSNSEEVYSPFHMYWMDAGNRLFGHYRGYGNITTIPNLSKRRLSSFPIPLPPLTEQRTIANVLHTISSKIEAEEQRKAALEALFNSLLHHLMTGKIRVSYE